MGGGRENGMVDTQIISPSAMGHTRLPGLDLSCTSVIPAWV